MGEGGRVKADSRVLRAWLRALPLVSIAALCVAVSSPMAGATTSPVDRDRSIPASGDQLWVARYDNQYGLDTPEDMAVSPDGSRVYVTGIGPGDYATVAYDATTGSQLWLATYNGHSTDFAWAIAVSPDGARVFVTGQSGGDDTVAYDAATGAQLWTAPFTPGRNFVGYSIRVSPDGTRVFVSGYVLIGSGVNPDYATAAYDAASGSLLWSSLYGGLATGYDIGEAMAVSQDGTRIFVTGNSDGATSYDDFSTVAYDAATGSQLWVARLDTTGLDDQGWAIGVSPDGARVFVTGVGTTIATHSDYTTIAYDSGTGTALWQSRYRGTFTDSLDVPSALAVSANGTLVFVTGQSGDDYATVAIRAATGRPLWAARLDGTLHAVDGATSLALASDGTHIYVTGYLDQADTLENYGTVAYSAGTGTQLWLATYDGTGEYGPVRAACCVRAGPDGTRVFVTGREDLDQTGSGYTTIAYQA
jgi:outer membrane protein assembly factor BamB